MRLTRVEIEGYRSIGTKVDIHVQNDVTVLLGPNDHGKTNILNALTHLNPDATFDSDADLNWDRAAQTTAFPSIIFHFRLDTADQNSIRRLLADTTGTAASADTSDTAGSSASSPLPQVPEELIVEITGTGATRQYRAGDVPAQALQEFVNHHLPRVEIFRPHDNLPDAVSVAALQAESHEFMRGILYYAGIDPNNATELFIQNDVTMRTLREASVALNTTLKADWLQGSDLKYELHHDSSTQEILLRIEDPAVGSRLVRASRRSSGFTHFFALKTILHARQQDHDANQYIFLFDEPGIYLHPAGQNDLLAVLDAIGRHNQVLYSTHSLFMINRTFPARHRLIVKDHNGTRIDGKPFVGRWGPAIKELGFSLAGTVLFAQHVLLAEGDADPVLVQAMFQKLVELNKANVDLNAFSVISTGDSRNADALIRILTEGTNAPRLLVMVDGDTGGKRRLKALEALLAAHNVERHILTDDTTIEDYLPAAGEWYIRAVARYVASVAKTLGRDEPSAEALEADLSKAAKEEGISGDKVTAGIAQWATNKAKEIAELDSAPSKLGIAREYVDILLDAESDTFKDSQLKRSLALLGDVRAKLSIPKVREPEQRVTIE